MKRILVPTDFSTNAMKAVTYSANIARRTGATIYLLHVIEPVTDNIRQPHPLHERLEEEIVNARLSEMETLEGILAETYPDLDIKTELAKGAVATVIADSAESLNADLIVMGTRGASGLKELFLGSVTGGTIAHTKIPVLAVPFEYLMEEPDAIVFATNRFEENSKILDKIIELASLFNAAVHVVAFVDTDTANAEDYVFTARQLDHYQLFLKKTYPNVTFTGELLEGERLEETIEKYDEKNQVDIIAMTTYPKRLWEKLLRKSATKKMALHSKIPLLAIPVA